MKRAFLLLNIFIVLQVVAQHIEPAQKKISPTLSRLLTPDKNKQEYYFVVAHDINSLKKFLFETNLSQNIVSEYRASDLLVIRSNRSIIDSIFIPSQLVKFIDIVRTPKEESAIDGFDLSTNKLNLAHDHFETVNGNGTVASVKENKPDLTDIDLK